MENDVNNNMGKYWISWRMTSIAIWGSTASHGELCISKWALYNYVDWPKYLRYVPTYVRKYIHNLTSYFSKNSMTAVTLSLWTS